jgi:hypothetical protein
MRFAIAHRLVWILAFLLVLIVLGIAADVAHAQAPTTRITPCNAATPNNAICVHWKAPETFVDGTPIVLPITYRVEQKAGTGAEATWPAVQTVTTTRAYLTGLAPGTYTFRVIAIVGPKESAPSNEAGRLVEHPTPAAPVIQVVQVVIGMDHAPVYKLTAAGKRDDRYADACGFIEVGKACGEFKFAFRDSKFYAVSDTDVKPWKVDCSGGAAPCAPAG